MGGCGFVGMSDDVVLSSCCKSVVVCGCSTMMNVPLSYHLFWGLCRRHSKPGSECIVPDVGMSDEVGVSSGLTSATFYDLNLLYVVVPMKLLTIELLWLINKDPFHSMSFVFIGVLNGGQLLL